MAQAQHVSMPDGDALAKAAERLAAEHIETVSWDEAGWHYAADAAAGGPLTAQYVLVLDALNWCFWPSTTGMEYEQLAVGIKKALEADQHALDAAALQSLTGPKLASWFAPHDLPDAAHRAAKLVEVGRVLERDFGGSAAQLVAAAEGSAVRLVHLLVSHFPGFRDETTYAGVQVAFYKRAQIAVADMWAAYGQRTCSADAVTPWAFHDMDQLTMFADYRVPQILRAMGVLQYSATLAQKIDSGEELPAGGAEEVEVRAATVLAVEALKGALAAGATPVQLTAVQVDWWLWQRGEEAKDSLKPHHKVRTPFY